VRVDRKSRRSEHLLQALVNLPRVRSLFRQGQISVQQNFFCHGKQAFRTKFAFIEGFRQTPNQTGSGKGCLVIFGSGLAIQHILVRFNPLHRAVRQLIAELDFNGRVLIHISIDASRIIRVIIVFVVNDGELHRFGRQSAAQDADF